jgi:hypothetical protein
VDANAASKLNALLGKIDKVNPNASASLSWEETERQTQLYAQQHASNVAAQQQQVLAQQPVASQYQDYVVKGNFSAVYVFVEKKLLLFCQRC